MEVYNNHDGSTGKISTSKGNQIKMQVGGYWYKTDYLGYEGLAEYLASQLLSYTNISTYAKYEMTEISLNGQKFNGCRSEDFLKKNEEIVTADRLFKKYAGCSVSDFLNRTPSILLEKNIENFVTEVEKLTKIQDYGKYLTKMLEWDEFILNDDRHFNNIAFVYNSETNRFSICTLFDNGAGFLSDTRYDYPLQKNVYSRRKPVVSCMVLNCKYQITSASLRIWNRKCVLNTVIKSQTVSVKYFPAKNIFWMNICVPPKNPHWIVLFKKRKRIARK